MAGVKQWIGEGMTMDWVIPSQGEDQEETQFVLQIRYVELRSGRQGIVLGENTSLPRAIEVASPQPGMATLHGKLVWLKGMDLVVLYNGDVYPLFRVEDVTPATGGTLCFHSFPSELDPMGKGEVTRSDVMMAAA